MFEEMSNIPDVCSENGKEHFYFKSVQYQAMLKIFNKPDEEIAAINLKK